MNRAEWVAPPVRASRDLKSLRSARSIHAAAEDRPRRADAEEEGDVAVGRSLL